MKKALKIVVIVLFASILYACDNKTEENTETKKDTVIQEEQPVTENEIKAEFSKFEDYAAIKTKAELIAEFGNENLKDGIEYYAEGTVEAKVSILTNPENKHIITFVWDEEMKTSWIEADYIIYDKEYNEVATQKIETNEGLFLGMSLSELREWNGADFTFSGFGWDFEGGIYGDDNRIKKSPVSVRLGSKGNIPDFTMGDVDLSADDERLKDAEIFVSHFELYFE